MVAYAGPLSGTEQAAALPEHVRALLAPGALAPAEAPTTLVQTHISYVILAGDRAYKLKKPVNLGFLDYSTLERRRAACEAEVVLNRRLTHGVYLGVAPVLRVAPGLYRLGEPVASAVEAGDAGPVEVVDYAVVMRRLPAERMLDHLVERDAVPSAALARLANHLADFYARAATGEAIDRFAEPDMLLTNWQENFLQTLPYVGRTIGARAFTAITGAVYRDLLRLRPLWQERIAAGRARDCHGDLRLSAVCLEDGIQVYDCIEFNDRFRYGDLASDIAFLTMDFDGHGRPDLADEFLAYFVAASGDLTLPAVLPFYRCYRAFVRGKVDSFELDEPEIGPEQRRLALAAARRRFAQALAYARRRPLTLTVVAGPAEGTRMGVATALAGRLGAVLVEDLDEASARLARRIPALIQISAAGEAAWRRAEALAQGTGAHLLVVACDGTDVPGATIRLPGGPLRAALAALHAELGRTRTGAMTR
jgi:aminoglycoside phosphotransferase family enzyme